MVCLNGHSCMQLTTKVRNIEVEPCKEQSSTSGHSYRMPPSLNIHHEDGVLDHRYAAEDMQQRIPNMTRATLSNT